MTDSLDHHAAQLRETMTVQEAVQGDHWTPERTFDARLGYVLNHE